MEPPPCVQNAMMTKDKKPFTYTPGGIDLSEVRSPRMARRIERNAHLPGSGDGARPAPRPQQPPLPAAALAAMRPQPQVQVFPSPPPAAPFRGAAPPPPPPPPSQGVPPPPPPPTAPLPTQKVRTGDNQVLERPDMTKIIPDNPMSLLRRTGGPQPRKSLVDEMFSQAGKPAPQTSPPIQPQNRYQPNDNERAAPISPVTPQPHSPAYKPQPDQYRPQQYQQQPQPDQYRPQQYQQQPQPDQYRPQQYQQQPQPDQYRSQQYQQQPQPDQYRPQQYQQQVQPDQYRPQQYQQQAQTDQYRPQQYQQQPQSFDSSRQQHRSPEVEKEPQRYQPPVTERQPPKPTAPREPQPDVKTSTAHLGSLYIPPVDHQQRRIVSPPVQADRNQDSPKVDSPSLREAPKPWQVKRTQLEETPAWAKKEDQSTPSPATPIEQQPWPQSRPTRPNPSDQQQQQPQQPIGVRIEIRAKPRPDQQPEAVYVTQPLVLQHPGPRDPSQPLVLQHPGPRDTSQQREQRAGPAERRGERIIPIRIEGAAQGGPGAERTLQRQQSNPTQSNKFKIIQKFTNTEDDDAETTPITEHSPKFPQNFQQQVSRGPQNNVNNGPHIRTVPIKMEGNEPQQQYVHPSEQVVPEPKKYMGSSIPGRSFRILQAMTAPNNNCANAIDQNEAFQCDEWEYNRPCLPYPYPPYWPHPSFPYPQSEGESTPRNTPTPRDTPVPFAPYWPPPYPYPEPYPPSEGESDSKATPRNTPGPRNSPRPAYPPFWGYPRPQSDGNAETCSSCRNTPTSWSYDNQDYNYYGEMPDQAPHYFDPYYYYYYYGYPPIYPPYPYYNFDRNHVEPDEEGEYDRKPGPRNEVSGREEDSEIEYVRPAEVVVNPPSPMQESIVIDEDNEEEESEDDMSNDASDEDEDEDDDEDRSVSDGDEIDNPHQLSVILEESERTESRMRSESALSNTTTLADNSEDESDFHGVKMSLPLKLCVTLTEEPNKQVLVEDGRIKTFDDTEMYASFTLRSPSSTPKKRSPCRLDDNEKSENAEMVEDEIEKEVLLEDQKEVENIASDDGKESDESEDWWGIIGNEDDMPVRKSNNTINVTEYAADLSTNSASNEESNVHTDIETCISSREDIDINVDNIQSTEEEKIESKSEIRDEGSSQEVTECSLKQSKNIYETVDDEKECSDGKLMQVDDFASQFAQIQENFGSWNLKVLKKLDIRKKTPTDTNHIESDRVCSPLKDMDEEVEIDVDKRNTFEKTETISNCSANYTGYNFSKSSTLFDIKQGDDSSRNMNKMYTPIEMDSDSSSDESQSSSDDNEDKPDAEQANPNGVSEEVKVPTIKERIQALKDSIEEKQRKIQENKIEIRVKDKVYSDTSSQSRSKTTSTKSSVKSLEEFSEEELDSGVTSDMSRHISDSEEFPEMRRLTRYQRAATHSRLFKLLQEECDQPEEEPQDHTATAQEEQSSRRNRLTLPLYDNSYSRERLIDETVQSFLRHRKAQVFKNVAEEKLRAAAAKILGEELELFDSPSTDCSSSFLSPQRNSTGYSTTVPTPQEFNGNYDEYRQYYDSWMNADATGASRECWGGGKNGGVAGSLAKCPRIASPQNLHQKMIRLLERPQTPTSRTKSNDFTNAS